MHAIKWGKSERTLPANWDARNVSMVQFAQSRAAFLEEYRAD
jgi:hypothetical protein